MANSAELTGSPPLAEAPLRVASVDALRGLTILLMVYVNDLGRAAPAWMHHIQPSNADGMTLADVVFPWFLFIAGVSIPLAITRSRSQGATTGRLLKHALFRSASLILMGIVEVNCHQDATLSNKLWALLSYLALIWAWCVVPAKLGGKRTALLGVKWIGIVGLLILLAIFRMEPVSTQVAFVGEVENWVWLRSSWWGILGLIGWSYLTTALLYLLLGRRREWLMGAIALLMLFHVTLKSGGFDARVDDKAWLGSLQSIPHGIEGWLSNMASYVSISETSGSLAALMMAGCLLGSVLAANDEFTTHRSRIRWALGFAMGLFVAGLMTDHFAGINKIKSTPTWCFFSASLATLLWTALYVIMDVKQKTAWSIVVRPAGANPLIAYLLHPILLWVIPMVGLADPLLRYKSSEVATVAIFGSLAMALAICAITGLIAKLGLRMRV